MMKYIFRNETSASMTVIIEPWAEEFDVPPTSVLSMEISAPEFGLLETTMDDKYFAMWLWPGSRVVAVSVDGKDQMRSSLSIMPPD
ncbi:MAG: hypothetical protein JOY83_06545 [Alphaproteobacteria bacterium]|nr:hypothetical protein [Alphaproteobacteria bacterium]